MDNLDLLDYKQTVQNYLLEGHTIQNAIMAAIWDHKLKENDRGPFIDFCISLYKRNIDKEYILKETKGIEHIVNL